MSLKKKSLRLLTWNLWFNDYLQVERLRAVQAYIEELNPHIVAFQEVTPVAETVFAELRGVYQKVPALLPEGQWYWEALYSRLPFSGTSGRFSFSNSEMGRGLTLLHIPELNLAVGCVHLESEDEHAVRRQQFSFVVNRLDEMPAENKIILGDMNCRQGQNLDDLLTAGWSDAWKTACAEKEGFTRDPRRNIMAASGKGHRLDRIYFKCRDFTLLSIRLIGTAEHRTALDETFMPSDHFGLLLDLAPVDAAGWDAKLAALGCEG